MPKKLIIALADAGFGIAWFALGISVYKHVHSLNSYIPFVKGNAIEMSIIIVLAIAINIVKYKIVDEIDELSLTNRKN